MKISLIEDEPDCSESYEALLVSRSHNVTTYVEADDAIIALGTIAQSDVVILDLMMQLGSKIRADEANETGVAIYKRLRKMNQTVKVVVVTARSKADDWHEFENDPNAVYIGKPISDFSEFCHTIEQPIK